MKESEADNIYMHVKNMINEIPNIQVVGKHLGSSRIVKDGNDIIHAFMSVDVSPYPNVKRIIEVKGTHRFFPNNPESAASARLFEERMRKGKRDDEDNAYTVFSCSIIHKNRIPDRADGKIRKDAFASCLYADMSLSIKADENTIVTPRANASLMCMISGETEGAESESDYGIRKFRCFVNTIQFKPIRGDGSTKELFNAQGRLTYPRIIVNISGLSQDYKPKRGSLMWISAGEIIAGTNKFGVVEIMVNSANVTIIKGQR